MAVSPETIALGFTFDLSQADAAIAKLNEMVTAKNSLQSQTNISVPTMVGASSTNIVGGTKVNPPSSPQASQNITATAQATVQATTATQQQTQAITQQTSVLNQQATAIQNVGTAQSQVNTQNKSNVKLLEQNFNHYQQQVSILSRLRATMMGISFSGFMISMAMKNLGVENEKAVKIASIYSGVMSGLSAIMSIILPIMEMYAASQARNAAVAAVAAGSSSRLAAARAAEAGATGIAAMAANPLFIPILLGAALALTAIIAKSQGAFKAGGIVQEDGTANVHKGEKIIPANQLMFDDDGNQTSGMTIHITTPVSSLNQLKRDIDRMRKSGRR